jgi:hypothetical protein
MIVNVRGCNGSGKTHTVRRFIERLPHEVLGKPTKPWGYKVDATSWGLTRPVMIVGSYVNACGGADGISNQLEIAERTVQASEYGHVLLEGLLVSKSSDKGVVAPILKEHGAIFGFLDTPWDVCLERVLARRIAAGNDKPFDPEKTMRGAYKGCHRSFELLTAFGCDTRWIPYQDSVGTVVGWLKGAENV